MVPLWKTFVEELYQEALIKVVFATETLAAGKTIKQQKKMLAYQSGLTETLKKRKKKPPLRLYLRLC